MSAHGLAADCVDTGKGFCVPVLYWYWLWAGAVVGSGSLAAYWRIRSRRIDRLRAELGETRFHELARDRGRGCHSRVTARRVRRSIFLGSIAAAVIMGVVAGSFWLAVDSLFSLWGLAVMAAIIRADWWLIHGEKARRASRRGAPHVRDDDG